MQPAMAHGKYWSSVGEVGVAPDTCARAYAIFADIPW